MSVWLPTSRVAMRMKGATSLDGDAAVTMGVAFEQVSDMIFILTPEVRVVTLNRAAARWVGMSADDVAGRVLAELAESSAVLAANRSLLLGMPQIVAQVDRSGTPFGEDEMTLFDGHGRLVTVSTRLDPLVVGEESLVAWTVRLLDERRMIFRASTVAMARLNTDGSFIQVNQALERLVGATEEDLVATSFIDLLHEEDRVRWRGPRVPGAGPTAPADTEYRLVTRSGRVLWCQVTSTILPGSHDVGSANLIVIQDITARREAESEAARTAIQHRLLARLATKALVAPDANSLARDVAILLREEAGAIAVEWTAAVDDAGTGITALSESSPRVDGRWFLAPLAGLGQAGELRVMFAADAPEAGAAEYQAESRQRFAESAASVLSVGLGRLRAEAALRLQGLRDPLTGLANRRLLVDRLQDALDRRHVSGHMVGVLFIDLDDFKPINDTFGHTAGDRLLVEFADRLRSLVRSSDIVSRWGGDEFVVLVQRLTDPQEAVALAHRITDSASQPFDIAGTGEIRLTASVGIGIGLGQTTVDQVLSEADESMYRIKRERGSRRRESPLHRLGREPTPG